MAADTPGRKGKAEKGGKDGLSEIVRIMSRDGLTVKDITARLMGDQPALVGEGECNPCFEESAGILYCDGSGVRVLPFGGSGVPVLLLVTGGVPAFVNHHSYLNTATDNPNGPVDPERAPAPRESNGGPGGQTLM
jgi:hypothetical protein